LNLATSAKLESSGKLDLLAIWQGPVRPAQPASIGSGHRKSP